MDETLLKHELIKLEKTVTICSSKAIWLGVQQFSDQEKNRLRWWNKYDLPRFKEVLLKEAAARPEGLPLETALLQRCRDYFEDYADEVLDKVGISDVDRYLETLKHKIDNPYQNDTQRPDTQI